jgi:hypothetical protein
MSHAGEELRFMLTCLRKLPALLLDLAVTAKVPIHSPEAGSFQFSQMHAMPNGVPSFIAIA